MAKKNFYSIVVTLYAVAVAWLILSNFLKGTEGSLCPLKIMFHVPCPFCGLTHACHYLVAGHVMRAVQANPLVLLAPIAVVALPLIVCDIFRGGARVYNIYIFMLKHRSVHITSLVVALLVWTYKIFQHFNFI